MGKYEIHNSKVQWLWETSNVDESPLCRYAYVSVGMTITPGH